MTELIVLRLIHVLSAVFWLGSGIVSTFFLVPVLSAAGPAGGAVMQGLRSRGLMTAVQVAAGLTMLSGARLYAIVSNGFSAAYFATPMGRTLGIAGLLAALAFTLAMTVGRPAQIRAAELAVGLRSASETERAALERQIGALRKRGGLASMISLALLSLSAAGMAVARYL